MRKLIVFLLAAALGSLTGLAAALQLEVTQVTDETMMPAFREGSHVIVNRMTFEGNFGNGRNIERGDVILFPNMMYTETGEDDRMMKRVIGLPGEWVSISGGKIYIDGEPLDESGWLPEEAAAHIDPDEEMVKQFVDGGQYFVLGDNRRASTDSRNNTVGLVNAEDIQGKVIAQW